MEKSPNRSETSKPDVGGSFHAFCAVASPRDLRVISNIQYFHKCKAGAKREGFKPTTTQIAPGDVPPGELELDEDILLCKHDEEFMEDGLAYLIASKKSWHEELHGQLAIEAAKEGHVFSDMSWDGVMDQFSFSYLICD